MRAAAAIMERHCGCAGAIYVMERVLEFLSEHGIATAELGSDHSTTEVVDALLGTLGNVDSRS
ncbi:MAG TPA: hypothetical protein VIY52_20430 [Streptosporangiaceae bacterium]